MTPKLFPDWADSAFRLATGGLVAVLVLGVGALIWYFQSPYETNEHVPYDQPVEFDHRHHVHDDGISCLFCHQTATTSSTAGLPPTELCMGCHSQIWTNSPLVQPLVSSYFTGRPLAWNRIYEVPDYVYFDHSIHVAKGVACVECHGRVDRMARVYKVTSLEMQWCLDCHSDPAPHLRDPSQVLSMTWKPPGDRRAYGESIMRRLDVKKLTDCYTCHR